MSLDQDQLSHLQALEAESIDIIREVAASFQRPVMMYSIGKDSSVMLHLARKAFAPGRIPFPLLHIDTTWKFREMIEFRDRTARELQLDLVVHTNQEGVEQGMNPFTHGSRTYTDVMKTQALKQALTAGRYDCAIGGARRDEEKSRAKERVFSFRDRKQRKRMFRRLWILRINAAARSRGINYSRFIYGLGQAGVELNRKQLSELAIQDPAAFDALVDTAKNAVGAK